MDAAARLKFDAIVVGGGPAGAATAILLAQAGWAVAVIERQRFPRRKVCGECLAASNLPLLDALGIGERFHACAGPELRQVALMYGDDTVHAPLPRADHPRHAWGRALGRETLDTLLLDRARSVGATVLQPWSVQAISGLPGAWHCELRAAESTALLRLSAPVVIDAHGAWEDLPSARPQRRLARAADDLFAFKANFIDASLGTALIGVLALEGGYGGLVVADGGVTTLACCIRRHRFSALRTAAPGQSAGEVIEAWLRAGNGGVRRALAGAQRDGPWLAAGPLDPGARVLAPDGLYRVGNAAGEAHPILGEGMSMALQSAMLLCKRLLAEPAVARAAPGVRAHPPRVELQRRYAADWHRHFAPRLRVASAFAHAAMHPRSAAVLMALARRWPALLTRGARWGGKVQAMSGLPGLAAESGRASVAASAAAAAATAAAAPQHAPTLPTPAP